MLYLINKLKMTKCYKLRILVRQPHHLVQQIIILMAKEIVYQMWVLQLKTGNAFQDLSLTIREDVSAELSLKLFPDFVQQDSTLTIMEFAKKISLKLVLYTFQVAKMD